MKAIRYTILTVACLVGLAVILAPSPAAADFVINDDLIVDGSTCIGFDCVNGESFGSDTLRFKEHNLRVHFDDTSTAASYPRNDWRIMINSSTNGGGSFFAVEDAFTARVPFKIEAGARTNSLYIDDGGRLGLRTSTPSTEIHTIDGDTPTVRLQQDGSAGFAPHTWDVAGNETNFFIRDVTDGSKLPFRIRPNSATSSIDIFSDKIQIGQNDQDVGVGTSSPEQALHVQRTGGVNTSVRIDNDDPNAPDGWEFRVNTNGNFQITRNGSGDQEFQILASTGNATFSGTVTTSGPTCGSGCDQVFSPTYELASIDEHAALMWQKGHLPEVGPTSPDQSFNLTDKTGRILNELEKAHIYIEQLHQRLARIEAQLAAAQAGD